MSVLYFQTSEVAFIDSALHHLKVRDNLLLMFSNVHYFK